MLRSCKLMSITEVCTVNEQSPTDYKAQLGEVLAGLRARAGKQRADAAIVLDCSEAKIGTIERGRSAIATLELQALLDLYGVQGDDRADVEHLAAEARRRKPRTPWGSVIPERLKRFFRIEETARSIRYYHGGLVHGLLQTEDYAREVIENWNHVVKPSDVDRLIQARMARQARLTSAHAPELHMVLAESAIRQRIGGREVMRNQLRHLTGQAERSNITIQVMPFTEGAYAANGVSFTLLGAPNRKTVVYLENLTDGILVDEPDRVARYESAFEELITRALPPAKTVELLDSVASEL